MPEVTPSDNLHLLSPELQKAFSNASKAERRPIEQLQDRQDRINSRVSLLNDVMGRIGKVRDMMPGLSTPIAIRELAVNSSDDKVVTGTADKSIALPGNHKIEILQLAKPATALSNGFPDRDDTRIGSGYFSFENGNGDDIEVYIDNENATLDGVARTINSAKVGMKATVITDNTDEDNPFRLLLSHEGSGADNDVSYPTYYFVDPEEEFYLEMENPAKNSRIKFEGFEMETPTNEVKDLIPGVTLNLKGITDANRPETVSLEQDIPQTITKVKEMVEGLNDVLKFVNEQNNMDENTDSSRTLGGDYGMRLTEGKIRSAITNSFKLGNSGPIRSMIDIGVMYNKNGQLDFDEKRFSDALNSNYDEVVNFLTGDGIRTGVMSRLRGALDNLAGPGGGVLTNQKKNYSSQVKRLGDQIERQEEVYKKKQARLMAQLGSAQAAMERMNSQGAQVQAQLGGGVPGQGR